MKRIADEDRLRETAWATASSRANARVRASLGRQLQPRFNGPWYTDYARFVTRRTQERS